MANPNNLTNEQIKQGYSTIEGAYDPVTGKLKTATNVITPDALAPQPKIQLPQTPQPTTPTVSPAQNMVSDLIAQYDLSQTEQQAQNFQNQGLEQYLKDIVGLQGETQALATEKEKAGVGTLRQDLQNINSQILKKQAELQQDDIQLIANMRAEERRDTLLPFAQMGQAKLAGDAQIVRALKNAEIGVLNAQALAKQGDIALAQQTAEEAVAIKYAPYKERIQSYENIVKALQPFLTSAEKKEANKQKLKGDLAMKEIEKEEQKEKDVSKMIIEATPNAPTNIIANAKSIADKGGSALEVAQALGQYGGDYLGDKLKRLQITKTTEEINKIRNEIKSSNISINPATLPNTSNGFIQKLLLTAKNDKNLDTSERQQLSKMGMVINQLGSLQQNLSKNNKTGVIKGRVNKLLGDLNLDKDITTINAQIQALIPNVARGIYGEVGVLTDADIANYKKTVANLTNSKDQNDAVLALTLKNALKSYENTLNTASNSGINVSGWAEDYLKIDKQVKQIEDRIGVSKQAVNDLVIKDKNLAPVVKELYKNGLTDGEILDALNAR